MMKNTLLVLLFLFLGFTGVKAQIEIPSKVYENFEFRFPDVTHKIWVENDNDEWQVQFDKEGKKYYAVFAGNGQWLITGQYIKTEQLPAKILENLDNKYKEFEVKKTVELESIDGKMYEVQLMDQASKYKLVFDAEGEILNEVRKASKFEGP
jgi:hypothetical protein